MYLNDLSWETVSILPQRSLNPAPPNAFHKGRTLSELYRMYVSYISELSFLKIIAEAGNRSLFFHTFRRVLFTENGTIHNTVPITGNQLIATRDTRETFHVVHRMSRFHHEFTSSDALSARSARASVSKQSENENRNSLTGKFNCNVYLLQVAVRFLLLESTTAVPALSCPLPPQQTNTRTHTHACTHAHTEILIYDHSYIYDS